MDELIYVYAAAATIVAYFFLQVVTRKFDPFAPTWLFFVGFIQVYIIQPISYHEWAVSVHGAELVQQANWRALWALLWFLTAYHLGLGRAVARALPGPPRGWPPALVAAISPVLVVWGLYCSRIMAGASLDETAVVSDGVALLRAFSFVMMVAAALLIVTGGAGERRAFLVFGLLCAAGYVLIWMFNTKRSHSLMGVLVTLCAYYTSRLRRPSWGTLAATAFAGALVVAIAITWRSDMGHERSFSGFAEFLSDFHVSKILESINMADRGETPDTYETEEYGGFLLMMATVPEKSDYDYGENYLRTFSTFIPRMVWPTKPVYGRQAWINAWIAGSEKERKDNFAGPAISILGATQLNGGALGTLIVVGVMAQLLRAAYEFFRAHAETPWAQFFWSTTYFNAWFMVVTDDPMVWFYYNWGFTALPIVVLMWLASRGRAPASSSFSVSATSSVAGTVPA